MSIVYHLPDEAVEFAIEQCLPRVELLNRFRQARYMASVDIYHHGLSKSIVDRKELESLRVAANLSRLYHSSREAIKELSEVAKLNNHDPIQVVTAGTRLARDRFRSGYEGKPQFLVRGFGIYPGLRSTLETKRATQAEIQLGRDRLASIKALEATACQIEADRLQFIKNRKNRAAQIRRDRHTSIYLMPSINRFPDGKEMRIGKPIHPSQLIRGDVVYERMYFHGMNYHHERYDFIRLNRKSWLSNRGNRLLDDFRLSFVLRSKAAHPIRWTAIVAKEGGKN